MNKKGDRPHIFRLGQVVMWVPRDEYVRIIDLPPLHCDLAEALYSVVTSSEIQHNVSEEVLRALTYKEIGIAGS
jgi:hypothetical protein